MDDLMVSHSIEEASKDIIKKIAMDIGKDTTAYIEVMYPEAVKATSSTFLLSVRNHIYNQIMASLETTNEEEILSRLAERKTWRRKWKAAWKKIRASNCTRTNYTG